MQGDERGSAGVRKGVCRPEAKRRCGAWRLGQKGEGKGGDCCGEGMGRVKESEAKCRVEKRKLKGNERKTEKE